MSVRRQYLERKIVEGCHIGVSGLMAGAYLPPCPLRCPNRALAYLETWRRLLVGGG